MQLETFTFVRELDHRLSDGIQVRLLWAADEDRLWVSVLNTQNGHRFSVEVEAGERPLDVFHHPFAYAAHHGVDPDAGEPAGRLATTA